MNAIIKDNIPYCPKCQIPLGKLTGEYSLVEHEGEKYTKFQRFCDGGCRKKYEYYINLEMDSVARYSFDNVKEVKDDETKREI